MRLASFIIWIWKFSLKTGGRAGWKFNASSWFDGMNISARLKIRTSPHIVRKSRVSAPGEKSRNCNWPLIRWFSMVNEKLKVTPWNILICLTNKNSIYFDIKGAKEAKRHRRETGRRKCLALLPQKWLKCVKDCQNSCWWIIRQSNQTVDWLFLLNSEAKNHVCALNHRSIFLTERSHLLQKEYIFYEIKRRNKHSSACSLCSTPTQGK